MTPLPCSPRMTFLMSWFFARGHIIHLLSTIMTEHSDFIRRVVPERGRKGGEGQQAWCSGSEIIHTFRKWGKAGVVFHFYCTSQGAKDSHKTFLPSKGLTLDLLSSTWPEKGVDWAWMHGNMCSGHCVIARVPTRLHDCALQPSTMPLLP